MKKVRMNEFIFIGTDGPNFIVRGIPKMTAKEFRDWQVDNHFDEDCYIVINREQAKILIDNLSKITKL